MEVCGRCSKDWDKHRPMCEQCEEEWGAAFEYEEEQEAIAEYMAREEFW